MNKVWGPRLARGGSRLLDTQVSAGNTFQVLFEEAEEVEHNRGLAAALRLL